MQEKPRNRVLVYHKVDPKFEFGLTHVTPKQFEKQIDTILSQGYKPVTLADLILDQQDLSGDRIAIVFDDGYEDIYRYAFPILKERKIPGTVFIITSCLGDYNFWDVNIGWIRFPHLGEKQVEELLMNNWEIGSHTVSHRCLSGLSYDEMRYEIVESGKFLEKTFGSKVNFLCTPFGKTPVLAAEIAIDAGYKGICGFYPFRFSAGRKRPFEIPRLAVYRTDTCKSVLRKLRNPSPGRFEILKQNCINFFSHGTLIVKSLG